MRRAVLPNRFSASQVEPLLQESPSEASAPAVFVVRDLSATGVRGVGGLDNPSTRALLTVGAPEGDVVPLSLAFDVALGEDDALHFLMAVVQEFQSPIHI